MPDIDIDFSVRGRAQVMRYVVEKYGRESVAQIVTFGKMFPRAATRDAARVLEHDYGVGDKLAKLIPDPIMGRSPSFEDCLAPGQQLRMAYDSDPIAKQIIDVAQGLEGIVRNSSIHAAAVVIAEGPLTDIVPLQLADSNQVDADGNKIFNIVTQFSMKPVEQLGLLKMDFLGLRNLDVIEDALDIIERSTGVRPGHGRAAARRRARRTRCSPPATRSASSSSSPRACRRRCATCARRSSTTSSRSSRCTGRARWTQIPTYARGKRNPESVEFADERLRAITESTKGVILYQEQSMQIAKTLAGFSGAKADDLRKAIGKKNREAMAKLEPEFREGCRASGTSEQVIEQLWATNVKAADYSFNKLARRLLRADRLPHRVAEGQLPGRVHGGADQLGHVDEGQGPVLRDAGRADGHRDPAARRQRLRPRLRRLRRQHPLRPGCRQGRRLRGGRGDQGRARGGRPVRRRCGTSARASTARAVNKKAIEALIKCGAFGSTGATRKGMLAVLEQAQGAGQKAQQDLEIGQGSIFDGFDWGGGDGNGNGAAAAFAAPQHPPIPTEEFEQPELLAIEKESIGLFISAHPLKQVREALRERVDCPLAELAERKDKDWVNAGGIITRGQEDPHAQRRAMMFATLDDLEGSRRDPRLRQGAGRVRGRARRRLGRRRARPRRPQGRRQDVPRRADRRAVRADARGGRAAKATRPRRARSARCRCTCAVDAARPAGVDHRRPQEPARELPRRVARSCSRCR